jgi:hypothetical protein
MTLEAGAEAFECDLAMPIEDRETRDQPAITRLADYFRQRRPTALVSDCTRVPPQAFPVTAGITAIA